MEKVFRWGICLTFILIWKAVVFILTSTLISFFLVTVDRKEEDAVRLS